MPNKSLGIKISKKISNFHEQKKLKSIVSGYNLSKEMGLIIRTASKDCGEKGIKNDFDNVIFRKCYIFENINHYNYYK